MIAREHNGFHAVPHRDHRPARSREVHNLANVSAYFERSALIEGDAFLGFLDQGAMAPWLTEANSQNEVVTRISAAATGSFVVGGYDTVFDGVVGTWFLPTFLDASGLRVLHYAVLMPTLDRCLERVATRQGHGFTDEPATRHMHEQFRLAPVDDRHVIADDTGSADDLAAEILNRFHRGQLTYPHEDSKTED